MQNAPERHVNRFRLIYIGGGCVIALAAVAFLIGYLLPSEADVAAEQRLLGKWAMWIEGSDMALPTQRIVEWLPNGQTAHYSPTMEPLGNSFEKDDRSSNWRIRNGKLIIDVQAQELKDGTARQVGQLDWQSDDVLRMTTDVGYGELVTVVYKRILSDTLQSSESGRTHVMHGRSRTAG